MSLAKARIVVPLVGLLMLFSSGAVLAEPMRIEDPTPRAVLVEFEVSSSDHPHLLDRHYTVPFPAWLENDSAGNTVVRIPGHILERSLFSTRNPVAGSFSEYVWVFDPDTGEVLSAGFSGTLRHTLDLGLVSTDIEAHVAAKMTTAEAGGFTVPNLFWGRRLRRFCTDAGSDGCTLVEPTRYDRDRGYVNAVGSLEIDSSFTSFSTFSALGEARFSEVLTRPGYDPSEGFPAQWVAAVDDLGAERPADVTANAQRGLVGVDVSAAPPSD
jgi:hypothetical protein